MKTSKNLKSKNNDKKSTDSKYKLNTIEIEPNSRFKNELFQKLYENNRINRYGNLHLLSNNAFHSPEIRKKTLQYMYKKRNQSYLYSLPKNKRQLKMSDSKIKNNNSTNTNSSKIIKTSKITKVNSVGHGNSKKNKNYPNLIKGVLHQVKYYNLNKNNYNDNIRYKPVDDFFNDQIQSPIYIGNIIENNNTSSNNSFNFDFKQEQKENNPSKRESKDINQLINNNDILNYCGNNRSMKNNDEGNNKEYFDKELRPERLIYRKINRIGNCINSLNSISPIKILNSDKLDSNEITLENFNSENLNKNDNDNSSNNIKNKTPRGRSLSLGEKQLIKKRNKRKKDLLKKDNNCSFKIDGIIKRNNNVFNTNLQPSSSDIFSINNDKIKNNNFNNLEINNCSILNYDGKKSRKKIKGQRYDKDGNLIFNNDDEVLKYIKDRIKEEKDLEYNNNKMKYNYFKLTKQFHGKLLYEIGLENNLNKINEILDKENVEIEHEPIMFIFKKDLNNYTKNHITDYSFTNEINNTQDEQINKLEQEKTELIKEIEKLQKKIDFQEKNSENSEKINTYKKENDKLKEDIQKMNEESKEKEDIINELQNILKEYETKVKQYEEEYNKLQIDKEKYEKYIIDLQEYNEQIINEYQKMKSQLESELQKNIANSNQNKSNYFNNESLKINTVDYFDIINTNNDSLNDIDKNDNEKEEQISNQCDVINYDFNEINNNDNMQTIEDFDNNNNEKTKKIKQKDESMNRAFQRIKNLRENKQKNTEEKDNNIKSEKIAEMAQKLEEKMNENKDKKNN